MYDEALALTSRFHNEYPSNTVMLRAITKLHLTCELFPEAKQTAEQLLELSENRTPINWSDYFSAGRALVTVLVADESVQDAVNEIDRLLSIDLDDNTLKLEWVKKHRTWLQDERVKIITLL